MKFSSQVAGFSVLVGLIVACFAPQLGGRVFAPIEQFGAQLSRRKRLCVCLTAISVALIRVSLLGIIPVPVPEMHDEFSYLLAADTFAHGRLTNPPHLMSLYFDTFHVNQRPTYMSIYPPAQGMILAVGQVLGNPWIGVLLSMCAMCAAILWMLQGWLPSQWALLGGILVVLRLGIFSYWMNSYWGGAVAATGGALVVGALPRILRRARSRDAIILGVGVAILANSRPFEGFILCIPVIAYLFFGLCTGNDARHQSVIRIVIPCCIVLFGCAIFIGYYNWRGTGGPATFPYELNIRNHFSIPQFIWQKAGPKFHFQNPQFDAYYNGWWANTAWANGEARRFLGAARYTVRTARNFVGFFLWPELCVPLIALPWILLDRRVRFLVVQFVLSFAAFSLVAWFLPHYAAPLTATTFALLTQGIRHLRQWRLRGRAFGVGLSRFIVFFALILVPLHRSDVNKVPELLNRARLVAQLDSMPGNQLVIVRYSSRHNVHAEWVYNRADIDDSHVVWAREIPGVSLQPLLSYFRGRDVWVVDADSASPRLTPYISQSDP